MSRPTTLQAHALERLQYIHTTIERAAGFTAVPGWGGVAMGVTALATALVAHGRSAGQWLACWVGGAVIAASIGMAAVARKADRAGTPLSAPAARRFALAFAPSIFAGMVLTGVFYRGDALQALPGCWLLLYGTAVVSAGAYSAVGAVPVMGAGFMALGLVAFLTPPSWGDAMMALGFGALQIGVGLVIARRHGG
jgi:hypothetical protein